MVLLSLVIGLFCHCQGSTCTYEERGSQDVILPITYRIYTQAEAHSHTTPPSERSINQNHHFDLLDNMVLGIKRRNTKKHV